jgi:NADH-quinone oxidoreductase subunit H
MCKQPAAEAEALAAAGFPSSGRPRLDATTVAQFFNENLLDPLFGLWGRNAGPNYWLGYVLALAVHIILLIHVVAVGALIFIWLERKVAGRIQDRLGPTRVGGRFGWLQTLADGIKLIAKEDITPKDADALLFKLAPYVSFAASFTAYMALPFANGWAAQEINVAVFFIVAVLGLEVFGVILAGYASGSKWSLFGGMREAAQVVSYEVPIGLCVVVPVMIVGSMNLVSIGESQAGLFSNWLIFHDPFTFMVFWVYFTCAVASVNRAPFDLAEAESELVAGFHTEYSGLRWSFFFMAEYGSMFLVSGLAAILFFGGWNGPIPIFHMLGWAYEQGRTDYTSTELFLGYIAQLAGVLNFILKAVLGVIVMMWVRWTLPRLRIDQVMTTCLKYCVPLAAFCFVFAMLWKVNGVWSPHDMAKSTWGRTFAETRENWVLAKTPVAAPSAPATPDVATAGSSSAQEIAP